MGVPWKKAARMPVERRPAMAASLCCGVGLLWHQSASVVVPQLSWFNAPMRVAMCKSCGVNTVAGNNDAAGSVDHFGAIHVQCRSDLDDLVAAHQHVGHGQVALAVHGDDRRAADQCLLGHGSFHPVVDLVPRDAQVADLLLHAQVLGVRRIGFQRCDSCG